MTDLQKPTFLKRARRTVFNISLTGLVVVLAGAAVVGGSNLLAQRADASAEAEIANLIPVSVTPITLQDGYSLARQFVGQIESAASVPLSFELGGRLSDLLVEEGQTIKAGQLIARLDTALLKAEQERLIASRAALTAQLDLAQSRLARATALRKDGFASVEAVDQATATRDELISRTQEVDAALSTVAINLEKSELFAPFDGRIGMRNVDGGETLAAGAPILTLIETTAPQVRVGLPLSIDIAALQSPEIVVQGRTYDAVLLRVRPDIDPVTRTQTAIFSLNSDDAPAFGQTATVVVTTPVDQVGTWLPLDAMQQGVGGYWTVLTVDDNTVRQASVEVLHAEATRAFVRGTFQDGARMIATGAHRVVPGQRVRVVE
ncbi:efflux RND transporter periplasmic adaptor subunit [Nereida sp. MMG025]|uniref:efflux RND transporter periplasmic adaptor subunit n=1 Tax=Nereida sp. MMG025 TaxID=2909981 RepID=UPI001F028459|nr:efflux RND transporter periplasmic adaptor subunit [Nereida sp. MMG025]MCF6446065.1 efflux RND transporter periplasmic adaptor subunit [Nereida sp. MMG025]